MLKQRQEAAEDLTKRLLAAEQALDDAISKTGELIGYMPVARKIANLSAVVGQAAILEAAETLCALVGARTHLVATHNRLADVRDQIGLKEVALGSGDMKPPARAEAGHKRIVSIADHAA